MLPLSIGLAVFARIEVLVVAAVLVVAVILAAIFMPPITCSSADQRGAAIAHTFKIGGC
jgi:hypothetical protein